MGKTADFFADEDVPRARVALLLEHFSRLEDDREPWRIVYPLSEVLLLLTCATIATYDDFDEIAAFGHHHLDLLRKFVPYYNGIPCERWLARVGEPDRSGDIRKLFRKETAMRPLPRSRN